MNIQPYRRRVHYYETDQMGIVHHSNYIRWFEEARVDLMDQLGCGYARMEELGVSSPVLGIACDYRSMVRFDDTVLVIPRLAAFTGAKMTLSYRVEDASSGELRATGHSRHCFLAAGGRPVSLKRGNSQIYALFADFGSWCAEHSGL